LVFSCPAAGRELATEPQEAGHEKLLEGILYLHFVGSVSAIPWLGMAEFYVGDAQYLLR
jgi:hypothetical protein